MSITDPEWMDTHPYNCEDVNAMAGPRYVPRAWVVEHAEELGGQRFPLPESGKLSDWRFPTDVDERLYRLLGEKETPKP